MLACLKIRGGACSESDVAEDKRSLAGMLCMAGIDGLVLMLVVAAFVLL